MNFNILITNDKFMKGIGAMSDAPQVLGRMAVVTAREMLTDDWDADAHFVCYKVLDPNGKELPVEEQFRLRKTIRGELEEKGAKILAWGFVGDWDLNDNVSDEMLHKAGWDGNPKKKPKITWTHELLDTFMEETGVVVEALRAKDIGPSYIYLTNHGARFLHFYDQDISVLEHEEIIRGMIDEYHKLGYVLDDACVDWTRMFRAPRVMRNGQFTAHQSWFMAWDHPNSWTCTALAPRQARQVDDYANVAEYAGDRPDPEEALALLVADPISGRKTDVYQKLKTLLYRRDLQRLHDILQGKDLEIPEGSRDKELTRLVGQLATHIYTEEWSSPELIYAVLLPVAEQLEPDNQTRDWLEVTWSLCRRMWTREVSKGVARNEKEQEEAAERTGDLETLLATMQARYPKNSRLHDVEALAYEELLRMGLVKVGSSIFVLRPDGYYEPAAVDGAVLPGTIRDLGIDFLMPTRRIGPRNGIIEFDAKDLLKIHGRSASAVVGTFGTPGGYIEDGRFFRPLFCWANHEPVHSEHVHTWLQILAGENWKELARWIAYAQDMRRPICSLALVGATGVGKGMLARGLQELIVGAPVPGSGADLVEGFTPALTRTPFLIVDEGLPVNSRNIKDVSDTFRRMVAGEPLWVDPGKYQPHVEVNIPFRILFTANNKEIVQGLVGQRTLTPEDRTALAERIKFIPLREQAAFWLRQQGGRNFTAGWIMGDGPSNFVVARHFRWLYENREEMFGPPDSDRFLVTGDLHSSIVDDLRVLNGVTPEVAKVCVYLVHTTLLAPDIAECISVDEDGVWVTTNAIICYYNTQSTMDKKLRLNEKNVGVALENLTTESQRCMRETGRGGKRQLRWRKLDLPFLLQHARNHGLPTERIEQYLEITT